MHGLGAKLREVREKRGMTQRELAARIHKSTPAISAYETDAQTPPTDVLISIAQVLHVPIAYLIDYGNEDTYEVKVAGYFRSLVSECIVMTDTYADSIGVEYHIGTVYTDTASEDIESSAIISGKQDKQTIMDSYVRARKVFAECFPDHPYKAFFCSSWLMSSDLHGILKPTSNILGFQEPFTRLPFKSTGTLVFSFAFDNVGAVIPTDIDALPENTSLQRAVKQLHREGGYIHEGAGFFF